MKLDLATILSGFNLSKINNNFTDIENELQDKVLYRDNPVGEPNAMENVIDMNSNKIINLGAPTLPSDAARLVDVQDAIAGGTASLIPFTPYLDIVAINVQDAIEEVKDDVEAADAAIALRVPYTELAATTGSGLVGFLYSVTYATGTLGKWIKDLALSTGTSFIGFIQSVTGAVPRTAQDKLREVVSALDLGFVGDGNPATFTGTNNSAAWATLVALVLDPVIIAKGGITVFFPDGVYCTDGNPAIFDHAGASFIHLEGAGHNSTRLIFRASSGLQFTSTGYVGTYETFHSRIVVENLMVVCQPSEVPAGTTDGVSLTYCAEVQLISVQAHYANEGLYIKDSPLVTTERWLATNCNKGISHKKSTSFADADLAVITHNDPWCSNNTTDMYIDGGRNITINNGSLVSTTALEIRATGSTSASDQVEYVLVDGTFIDYTDFTTPSIKIGNPADTTFQIKRVELKNLKFGTSPSFTKDIIRIDSPLVGYVSADGGECSEVVPKFMVIGSSCLSTLKATVDGISANNCFKYRIRDERSTTVRSELFVHDASLQLNPDFFYFPTGGYFPFGYEVVQPGNIARYTAAFVTGDSAISLLGTGSPTPPAAAVWKPDLGDKTVEQGSELTIEWIILPATSDAKNTLYITTENIGGGGSATTVADPLLTSLVQEYTNGFSRLIHKYRVPNNKIVVSIQIQGAVGETCRLDYFAVYGPDKYQPSELLYGGVAADFATVDFKVAKYRGRKVMKRVAGEADEIYACRRDAAGTFSWQLVV